MDVDQQPLVSSPYSKYRYLQIQIVKILTDEIFKQDCYMQKYVPHPNNVLSQVITANTDLQILQQIIDKNSPEKKFNSPYICIDVYAHDQQKEILSLPLHEAHWLRIVLALKSPEKKNVCVYNAILSPFLTLEKQEENKFENYLPQVKRFILVANNLDIWLNICIDKTKQT